MLAMAEEAQPEEAMTESDTLNTAVYGGGAGDRSPEDAPRATPAPEPASAQSDSLAVVPSVAEVRRLDEAMVLHDVEALMGALAPQETELRFDPASRESSCTLTLETDSGTERTLEIYFDGDHVWVAEENEIYLASCTPEEFEALR